MAYSVDDQVEPDTIAGLLQRDGAKQGIPFIIPFLVALMAMPIALSFVYVLGRRVMITEEPFGRASLVGGIVVVECLRQAWMYRKRSLQNRIGNGSN